MFSVCPSDKNTQQHTGSDAHVKCAARTLAHTHTYTHQKTWDKWTSVLPKQLRSWGKELRSWALREINGGWLSLHWEYKQNPTEAIMTLHITCPFKFAHTFARCADRSKHTPVHHFAPLSPLINSSAPSLCVFQDTEGHKGHIEIKFKNLQIPYSHQESRLLKTFSNIYFSQPTRV